MAVGQGVLAPVLDVAALRACEGQLELLTLDRCAAHAARLRWVLRMHAVFVAAGCRESTTADLALLEQTSEHAATTLLEQALLLSALPGGVEAVECGLLSEQQAAAVTRKLLPADDLVRVLVWRKLQARLLAAFEQGVVLPPARLAELVGGWVISADADAAAERRKAAARGGGVSYQQRDDGLVDITVFGLTGPDAHAVLSRIRDRAKAWGADDDRTAEARRRDAAVALWLGRDQHALRDSQNPFDDDDAPADGCTCGCQCPSVAGAAGGATGAVSAGAVSAGAVSAGASPCGCRPGEPVPCGIGVSLLIPLGAALGTTDELAVLEGHGPIEPDLAQAILHTAPVIRPVWADAHGVPVAVGDSTVSPPRGDPAAVRHALLALATSQPPRLHPRHPDDHPHPEPTDDSVPSSGVASDTMTRDHVPGRGVAGDGVPDGGVLRYSAPGGEDAPGLARSLLALDGTTPAPAVVDACRTVRLGWWQRPVRLPAVLTRPHPTGTPGAYRPSTRLARLLRARSPRCEWPGCGAWAVRCDLDHDRAHPAGPTCACNLGPLCRHHHRLKQTVWHKTRRHDGVHWSSPTGRHWLSPTQHGAPQPALRPLPAPPDLRGPGDPHHDEDGSTDTAWLTGKADRLRADEHEPDDEPSHDPYRQLLGAGWGLALDDPTRWRR